MGSGGEVDGLFAVGDIQVREVGWCGKLELEVFAAVVVLDGVGVEFREMGCCGCRRRG